MKSILIQFLALSVITLVKCHEEDVYAVQYNAENFATELPKKNHFVMFYAPW